MVRIYPKRFSLGIIKMLHVRSIGLFKILNKLNCNTYIIDLPKDYGIGCTFNVNYLVDYKSSDCSTLVVKPSAKPISERPPLIPLPDIHLITAKLIKF